MKAEAVSVNQNTFLESPGFKIWRMSSTSSSDSDSALELVSSSSSSSSTTDSRLGPSESAVSIELLSSPSVDHDDDEPPESVSRVFVTVKNESSLEVESVDVGSLSHSIVNSVFPGRLISDIECLGVEALQRGNYKPIPLVKYGMCLLGKWRYNTRPHRKTNMGV